MQVYCSDIIAPAEDGSTIKQGDTQYRRYNSDGSIKATKGFAEGHHIRLLEGVFGSITESG